MRVALNVAEHPLRECGYTGSGGGNDGVTEADNDML